MLLWCDLLSGGSMLPVVWSLSKLVVVSVFKFDARVYHAVCAVALKHGAYDRSWRYAASARCTSTHQATHHASDWGPAGLPHRSRRISSRPPAMHHRAIVCPAQRGFYGLLGVSKQSDLFLLHFIYWSKMWIKDVLCYCRPLLSKGNEFVECLL